MSEIKKLTDLQPDDHNANRGTQRGVGMLDISLRQRGAGRSILIDRNQKIIAGNKTHQAAVDMGLEDVIIVKTRGNQLVAVQREDLDLDDPTTGARELAYLDNRTSEVGLDWNPAVVISDLELGLDLSNLWNPDELSVMLEEAADSIPDFKEYDETVEDDVKYCTCPSCGHKFPA